MARTAVRQKKEAASKVEQAQRKLQRAQEDLERWEHQRDQYALDLAEAEKSLGERVVDGVDPEATINRDSTKEAVSTAASQVTQLRAELEAAKAATEVAHGKIDKAQRNVWLAQADELLTKAKGLRARARRRQHKTDELLEQLLDHEGVDYVPTPEPHTDSSNPIMDAAGIVHYIPKTQALLNEAAQLEYQATALQDQAANTPEARAELAEQRRKAREEWIEWERQEFERKEAEDAQAKVRRRIDLNNDLARTSGSGRR